MAVPPDRQINQSRVVRGRRIHDGDHVRPSYVPHPMCPKTSCAAQDIPRRNELRDRKEPGRSVETLQHPAPARSHIASISALARLKRNALATIPVSATRTAKRVVPAGATRVPCNVASLRRRCEAPTRSHRHLHTREGAPPSSSRALIVSTGLSHSVRGAGQPETTTGSKSTRRTGEVARSSDGRALAWSRGSPGPRVLLDGHPRGRADQARRLETGRRGGVMLMFDPRAPGRDS